MRGIKKNFSSKQQIFDYILNNISNKNDLVLIRGSTAHEKVKEFSDFDVEVYGKTKKKPFYKILFFKGKIILLTVYFYEHKNGNRTPIPKNIRILQGIYNDKIDKIFQKEIIKKEGYSKDDMFIRKRQLILDFFFKYMRSKDENILNQIQNKLKFKK